MFAKLQVVLVWTTRVGFQPPVDPEAMGLLYMQTSPGKTERVKDPQKVLVGHVVHTVYETLWTPYDVYII